MPGIMIPGGHLTQKLLTKVSSLFVTNEHSQIPSAREHLLRAHHKMAAKKEEMNGQDYGIFARYSQNTDLSPN